MLKSEYSMKIKDQNYMENVASVVKLSTCLVQKWCKCEIDLINGSIEYDAAGAYNPPTKFEKKVVIGKMLKFVEKGEID